MLNWEKCHFMVREGIVLRHLVSEREIEVDKAKIEVIEQLPPSVNVEGICSFLGQAGFYRCFIKDFPQIARSLTNLLAKDAPFESGPVLRFWRPGARLRMGPTNNRSIDLYVKYF